VTSTAVSRSGVTIRLSAERWSHIVAGHAELAPLRSDVLRAIAAAERVVAGHDGTRMAIRTMESRKALVVVYRELTMHDGFVITAFVTKRFASLDRRPHLWPPKN
jgi:hypothetical protein